MITIIRFRYKEKGYTAFRLNFRAYIYVYGLHDGIVEVHACPGMTIEKFAEAIEGCFDTLSNFESEILNVFNHKPGTKIKGIKVIFNDIHVCTATKEEHNARDIARKYFEAIDAM